MQGNWNKERVVGVRYPIMRVALELSKQFRINSGVAQSYSSLARLGASTKLSGTLGIHRLDSGGVLVYVATDVRSGW